MSFSDHIHLTAKQVADSFSMSSQTGVTSGTSLIGGLQEYYHLSNITYSTVNGVIGTPLDDPLNFIPLIYTPGGTQEVEVTCDRGVTGPCFETITTPALLELNRDLMSSGRLKLGMVVYVIEKNQSYQFMIDDYETLYNAAVGDISVTQYNAQVSGDNAPSQALINAWINHKVEGESNGNGGVWTRDEANWKKYPNEEEYFAINNVPASELIDNFNFQDAIIVVPPSWHNKKVLSVTASIFTTGGSNTESTITLNQSAADGTKSEISWTHPSNSKNSKSDFTPSLTLIEGATLHLSQIPKFGAGNSGYTATFKVKG